MNFSLGIIDLTANIHVQANIYHTVVFILGDLTKHDVFSSPISLPVNFMISALMLSYTPLYTCDIFFLSTVVLEDI